MKSEEEMRSILRITLIYIGWDCATDTVLGRTSDGDCRRRPGHMRSLALTEFRSKVLQSSRIGEGGDEFVGMSLESRKRVLAVKQTAASRNSLSNCHSLTLPHCHTATAGGSGTEKPRICFTTFQDAMLARNLNT